MDTRYIYCQDANFNVVALTADAGVIVEKTWYEAYGQPTWYYSSSEQTSSSVANPLLFQGRRYCTESGLYYFRNRDMSPTLGRFLQRDPLGYADGASLYEPFQSCPSVVVDPLGSECCAVSTKVLFLEKTAPNQKAVPKWKLYADLVMKDGKLIPTGRNKIGFQMGLVFVVDVKEEKELANCHYYTEEYGYIEFTPTRGKPETVLLTPHEIELAKMLATPIGGGKDGYQRYVLYTVDSLGKPWDDDYGVSTISFGLTIHTKLVDQLGDTKLGTKRQFEGSVTVRPNRGRPGNPDLENPKIEESLIPIK